MRTDGASAPSWSRGEAAASARPSAWQCAQRGWAVAVNYTSDRAAADAVVARILASGGKALAVQADVADEAAVLRLFETVDRELPPLQGLVNNAGVVDLPGRVDAMTVERLQRMFAINVFGSFMCAREAVKRLFDPPRRDAAAPSSTCRRRPPAWVRRGSTSTTPPPRARSTSSRSAWRRRSRPKASASTRSGPGIIETDIHASGGTPDRAREMAPNVPLQRAGSADEVAEAIVWLLSDASSYTTGAVIDVTGGR